MKRGWIVPCLVLLAHALLFGRWIVDDAGISFAYARNLAAGHGLVSQPGLPPVEGFSNFLWTVGLAPAFLVHLFHPVITPKVLSLALLAGSFFLLDRSLITLTGSRAVSRTALLLLAICAPFVIWTVSGLENPLYVFLICLLLRLIVLDLPLAAGVVAAATAMTRPDGLVFAVLYPLLISIPRPSWGRLIRYGSVLVVLLGGFLLFRWSYFGDLYPNTYHAKGGPTARDWLGLLTLQRPWVKLFESVAGWGDHLLVVALIAGTAFLIGRRRFSWGLGVLLAFAYVGAVPYLLLPPDWMPEYRFATPFFPFLYSYAVALAAAVGEEVVPDPRRRRFPALAGGLAAVGLSLVLFAPRSALFSAAPIVPFEEVEEKFGLRFNRFAGLLGLEGASVLLPDVGGTLWTSRLRVYDLVGLTDRTIARTLDKDHQAFYDYVFDTVKPTFIHTHHYWTYKASLDRDPRFARDYVPLFVFVEPVVQERAGGEPLRSGDFVRRDVLDGKEEALKVIRTELAEYYEERAEAEQRAGPRHMEGGS